MDVINAKLSTVNLKQPFWGATLAITAILAAADIAPINAYVAPSAPEQSSASGPADYILSSRGELLPITPSPEHLVASVDAPSPVEAPSAEPTLKTPVPLNTDDPSTVASQAATDLAAPRPAGPTDSVAPVAETASTDAQALVVGDATLAQVPDNPISDPVPEVPSTPSPPTPSPAGVTSPPTLPPADVTSPPTLPPAGVTAPAVPTAPTDAAPTVESPSTDGANPEDSAPQAEETPPEAPAADGSDPNNAPVPVPVPPPAPTAPAPTAPTAAPEKDVLVSEVLVEGAEGDLALNVYEAISTRPGRTATRSQIQADINAIFATGLFSQVRAEPSDTPLGVRVTYFVQPNPVLRSVQLAGNRVLAQDKVDEIFASQYGSILNLNDLQAGIQQINKLYQDQGFVLGQVVGSPNVDGDGTVTLQVAEGQIEAIDIRYLNEDGEPTKGKTRKFIITRELDTKPGDVLNRDRLQTDLQRVFALGLFEDVQVALEPGEDPRKVVVNLNVQERSTGSFSAGAGFSSRSGFFGTGSYTQSNLGGNNQTLNVQIQIGTRELLFDTSFTDPWIAGDPYGTSYTVSLFNRLTIPLVFDEGPFEDNAVCEAGDVNPASACDVRLPNGDAPRVNRLGGGVTFTRPLTKIRDKRRTAWIASVGAQYQRVSIRDSDLDIVEVDNLGNPLSFSGNGQDDLFSVRFGLGRDLRNDPLNPTKGSAVRLGVEQWVPLGSGSIFGTRLRGSYSHFLPVNLLRFTKGPQALAFNVQAGTVIGDLPPYEAFTLGGSSSVRGFNEGDLGSGRSFFQSTAEYRFPILKFLGGIGGVLFFDYGTNLGTQRDVIGSPGFVRGKPGDGFGYGVGIRVKTPIGPVRLDYGFNNEGDDQFHFGFGQRF